MTLRKKRVLVVDDSAVIRRYLIKLLEDAGLVRSFKDGLWVNYSLADGSESPYSANMIGNLKHWLNDETVIKNLNQILPGINRENIVGK